MCSYQPILEPSYSILLIVCKSSCLPWPPIKILSLCYCSPIRKHILEHTHLIWSTAKVSWSFLNKTVNLKYYVLCVSTPQMQLLPVCLWSNVISDFLNNTWGNRRQQLANTESNMLPGLTWILTCSWKTSSQVPALLSQLLLLIAPSPSCNHSFSHSFFLLAKLREDEWRRPRWIDS